MEAGGGGGAMARRIHRVQSLFLKNGMQSKLIALENETTMHCWIPRTPPSKDREPLLLIHGFGANGMLTWDLQIAAFAQEFAVYVPDLIFFGESTTLNPLRSEEFQAECLVAMMRQLGVHSGVNVVGTSYGGAIAFQIAHLYPALLNKVCGEVGGGKVVMASTGICMDSAHTKDFADTVEVLLPTTAEGVKKALNLLSHNPPPLRSAVYQEILEVMYLKNRDRRLELLAATSIGSDQSRPVLTQEVLLVWGETDKIFDLRFGLKLKEHLGDRAQLVVIEKTGHTPQAEAPRVFNDAIISFLKGRPSHQSSL